jgi:pSer/pThr/pTyr-binding forkhead associated (FHA) protein
MPEPAQWELRQPFALIGRSAQAGLLLDDPSVSQRHAYLQVVGGRIFCLDLNSRTGLYLGGAPRRSA